LFGIVAALCLVAGMLLATDTPDGDAPDEEWVEFTDDNAGIQLVRAYLLIVASLSLVAFYSFGLRPLLGDTEPVDRALAHIGAGATLLAAAAFSAGGLTGVAVGAANMFGDVPIDPSLARTFDNYVFGFVLVAGALSMACVIAVVAIQTWRRRVLAQWVGWLSLLAIVGMLGSIIFVPFVLLPIWLLAVSAAILARGRVTETRMSRA
jgi:hypothetical protein